MGGALDDWGEREAQALLVVALVGLGLLVGLGRRSGATIRGSLRSASAVGVAIAASMLATTAALALLQLRPGYRAHFRGVSLQKNVRGLGLPETELLNWGFVLLGVATTIAVLGRARRRATPLELTIGTSAVTVAMATLTTLGMVGTSYLFSVPAVFLIGSSIAWIVLLDAELGTWRSSALHLVGAIPAVLIGAGLLYTLQFLTLANIAMVAPFIVLMTAPAVIPLDATEATRVVALDGGGNPIGTLAGFFPTSAG